MLASNCKSSSSASDRYSRSQRRLKMRFYALIGTNSDSRTVLWRIFLLMKSKRVKNNKNCIKGLWNSFTSENRSLGKYSSERVPLNLTRCSDWLTASMAFHIFSRVAREAETLHNKSHKPSMNKLPSDMKLTIHSALYSDRHPLIISAPKCAHIANQ